MFVLLQSLKLSMLLTFLVLSSALKHEAKVTHDTIDVATISLPRVTILTTPKDVDVFKGNTLRVVNNHHNA